MPGCCKMSFFTLACRSLTVSALLAISSLTGCAATTSPAPLAMMSATCAPGQKQTTMAHQTQQRETLAESDASAVKHEFAPLFAATCRPDHQFTTWDTVTHVELALAFIEARPAPTYHFMPMFGATASPAARRNPSTVPSPADLADAAP